MAWLFGKKKQEPVEVTKASQTQADKPKMVEKTEKQYFPERDKKTLKRMLDDATMISIRLNQARPPRLSAEELMTAAIGFYLDERYGSSYRFMKDLANRREAVGEWTYYAINLFAFDQAIKQKEPKMAGDLRIRQIAEDPAYKVQPGDILGVTRDICSSTGKLANMFIDKEALLRALGVRLLKAKSAAFKDAEAGDFSYNKGIAEAYLYQAVADLAESDLWEKHPSATKNYYPERLQKQENQPLAMYWLYQCDQCGLVQESADAFDRLKKAADAGYPPAVHQLYVDHRDQLSAEEKERLEAKMAEVQSLFTEYLLQMDENNIESFTTYTARTAAETKAIEETNLAAQLFEQSVDVADQDTVALDMFRAASLGNMDAYQWMEAYACEKKVPEAQAAVAGRLYEKYQTAGDIKAWKEAKQLYEEAAKGGSGEANYQLWLHFDDFYKEDDPDSPAFRLSFLQDAVRGNSMEAIVDYARNCNPNYYYLKVVSDRMEETLKTSPSFIHKWHAMNVWRCIALSQEARLPLAAFALAGFCKLYFGRKVIGTMDYRPKHIGYPRKISEVKPEKITGYAAARIAVAGDADERATLGELFRDDPEGLLGDLKGREKLAQLWFRLAELSYLRDASSVNSYAAARLCRFYALDMPDYDKAAEWYKKAFDWKSLYVDLVLWDCRTFFNLEENFLNSKIYKLTTKTMDPGYAVGTSLERYTQCDVNNREERWRCVKTILEGEQVYIKQLIDKGAYDVEHTSYDPEYQALLQEIGEGLLRIPGGFTEEEQLHLHEEAYIHEKYLEQQRIDVLAAIKEHFVFD